MSNATCPIFQTVNGTYVARCQRSRDVISSSAADACSDDTDDAERLTAEVQFALLRRREAAHFSS